MANPVSSINTETIQQKSELSLTTKKKKEIALIILISPLQKIHS